MSADMTRLTERQRQAWPELVKRAADRGAPGITETGYGWRVTYQEEVRPGRGNDIEALWCDGENFVQIGMDVYGSGRVAVASVEWIHADDTECECDVCLAEYAAEDIHSRPSVAAVETPKEGTKS